MLRVAVVAGGPRVDLPDGLEDWTIVAADSGVAAVLAAGLTPEVVVGDLDSIDPAHLAAAEAAGARIDRHPAEKDATDLELALDAAVALAPEHLLVVLGLDGREDHALAGALLLTSPRYAAVPRVDARIGDASVIVVRGGDQVSVAGAPGDLVSILPVHGDADGVTTSGLRYPLHDEPLPAGTTRGVSNVLLGTEGSVSLRAGTLLVVLPGGSHR